MFVLLQSNRTAKSTKSENRIARKHKTKAASDFCNRTQNHSNAVATCRYCMQQYRPSTARVRVRCPLPAHLYTTTCIHLTTACRRHAAIMHNKRGIDDCIHHSSSIMESSGARGKMVLIHDDTAYAAASITLSSASVFCDPSCVV